jgi:hypothetical protein
MKAPKPKRPLPKIHFAEAKWTIATGVAVDTEHWRPMNISNWGRSSPKDDYRSEAQRRLENREVRKGTKIKAFANALHDWCRDTWPKQKPPAPLTIERNIRDIWHRYRD